jgi:hypothetical protein
VPGSAIEAAFTTTLIDGAAKAPDEMSRTKHKARDMDSDKEATVKSVSYEEDKERE